MFVDAFSRQAAGGLIVVSFHPTLSTGEKRGSEATVLLFVARPGGARPAPNRCRPLDSVLGTTTVLTGPGSDPGSPDARRHGRLEGKLPLVLVLKKKTGPGTLDR